MILETVKMSSKGQIVIPQEIREEIHVSEGTIFAVIGSKDTIILKKITTPSKEELIKDLKKIAREGRERTEKFGIKETDVSSLVQKARKSRKK